MAQKNLKASTATIKSKNVSVGKNVSVTKSVSVKPTGKSSDQSFYDWLKANWSKPILSPGELKKQKDFYEKQNKRPLKEQILKKYN